MLSKKVEWLIAGLGNPGKRYVHSRHNIGWMVLTELAARYKKPVMAFSSIYMHAAMRIEGNLVLGILPTTYMNKSGEAVRKVCELYDIPNDRVVVVADEYNFPLGKLHLRPGGGDGGHNGILSIIDELNTTDFYRLRCGIGKNFPEGGMVEYVLRNFEEPEIPLKTQMINEAVDSIECLVRNGAGKAMSMINSGSLWKPDEKDDKPKDLPKE